MWTHICGHSICTVYTVLIYMQIMRTFILHITYEYIHTIYRAPYTIIVFSAENLSRR